MKREGHLYEQMWDWDNLVKAEWAATKDKCSKRHIQEHARQRIKNLVEIQQSMINGTMRTDEYLHEQRVSGQDKLRDISKLHFHPNHIQQQSLTLMASERVERTLIRHTYASRIGKGQLYCALQIKKNLRKMKATHHWYAQCDICKYYENIPHSLIRSVLERVFKDEKFISAFMEPFERFSSDGRGIPLGIRPSQMTGNLVLSPFDHFMTEELRADGYVRYLDDFIFFGETKGAVKWRVKRVKAYLGNLGFKLHEPKIHRISEGIDMMGFVYYGTANDMWWRKTNKVKWLRRRGKVTNPKRKKELDDAAFGMLKWGNSHGLELLKKYTDRIINKKEMPVRLGHSGINRKENCDENGVPFLEAKKMSIQMIIDEKVEVVRWAKNIRTRHGDGRYAIVVRYNGADYKIIVNSYVIKNLINDMERNNVTRFSTVFTEDRANHYGIDSEQTDILEVNDRGVEECGGHVIYSDTKEEIVFN